MYYVFHRPLWNLAPFTFKLIPCSKEAKKRNQYLWPRKIFITALQFETAADGDVWRGRFTCQDLGFGVLDISTKVVGNINGAVVVIFFWRCHFAAIFTDMPSTQDPDPQLNFIPRWTFELDNLTLFTELDNPEVGSTVYDAVYLLHIDYTILSP